MARRKVVSISQVKNKEGRVDCLLFGLSSILTKKLEEKLNLPGLAGGMMPILEKEIKRAIPAKTVIPEEYRELTKVIGEHVDRVLKQSSLKINDDFDEAS